MTAPDRNPATEQPEADEGSRLQTLTSIVMAVCLVGLLVEAGVWGWGVLAGGNGPIGTEFPPVSTRSLDGAPSTWSPATTEHQATLLLLLTTSCPICQSNAAGWNELHETLGDRVRTVGLSFDDAAKTERFIDTFGVSFAVELVARPEALQSDISLPGVPMTIALDPEGVIRHFWYGPIPPTVRMEIYEAMQELVPGLELDEATDSATPATEPEGH